MVTSELGACEWFVWDLRRSGLIDRGQLDQVVGEFLAKSPRAEPPALAEFLVKQKILSAFQAERILQSKTQGLVLGPYVLVDAIGAGSMGQVYKAQSKTDNQWYAVKVLPRRSMWNVRLARRQVRGFSQFTHPAVVPFVDVGTAGGQHYLVWPLVEGETLEARVLREGRLSNEVTAVLMTQIAQGLAAAHGHGLFHGQLKPSNILIGQDGQARLLDFGIGSLLAENEGESLVDTMSTANTLTSGLDCSSPESIMEPTNRTQAGDQYSFGCVLYFCLAGQYPFGEGTAVEKMMAHQFKQPTPLREVSKGVPDGLVTVIERLMQKSPDGRYAGVDEVVDALHPFAQEAARRGTTVSSPHSGQRAAAPPPAPHPAPIAPSRFDAAPAAAIGPSRFDAGPAPVAASRFDSVAGSRPGAGQPPPPPARTISVTGTHAPAAPPPPTPPAPAAVPPALNTPRARPPLPATPIPAAKKGADSRLVTPKAPEPTPQPPARRPAPPAPPTLTRASLNRQAAAPPPRPAREAPRNLPVATLVASVAEDDDIPEALPLDDDSPGPSRFNTGALGEDWGKKPSRGVPQLSMLLVCLVALLITAAIYLVAKSLFE
jgi:serine/threonine protein kinase